MLLCTSRAINISLTLTDLGEFLSEFFLFYFVISLTIEASLLKSGAFSLEYLPIEYKSSKA